MGGRWSLLETTRCWCEAMHTAAGGLPPGRRRAGCSGPARPRPRGPNGSGSRRTRPRNQPRSALL